MLKPCHALWIASFALAVLNALTVSAQDYPNKPIRIVTSEPGGGQDFMARLIAPGISGPLGQQVIVDNRGGGGIAAGPLVAKALPDGYTLLIIGNTLWIAPLLRSDVPYDPVRDFTPITLVGSSPNILVVHPSLQAKSIKELIALAKSKPGELNYASGSTGGPAHLAGELFKALAGLNIVRIPYRGNGPAVTALIGGQVQFMLSTAAGAAPHVKTGTLRALGVTSAQPSALLPGLPTIAASGLPGYEFELKSAAFAPAKTPEPIVRRLNQEMMRTLNQSDVKQRLFDSGVETVGSSPQLLAAAIKAEMSRMGKVIKDAGIREE